MSLRGSMSATTMCSSILWMLALGGPSSITWGHTWAMKRPSLVPPVVECSVVSPVSAVRACCTAPTSSPGVVKNGWPPSVQRRSYSRPWRSSTACTRCCRPSAVDSVEKRKLKSITTSPGITLVAPVPPCMLLICQLVGGKNALPSSHTVAASSVSAVAGQLRVGNVPLNTAHRELATERAAPPVLDHVTRFFDGGGFSHDAVIELFTTRLELLDHDLGAVHRGAFLVAGQKKSQRDLRIGRGGQELFHRHDKGGDGSFHIAGTTAIELAVLVGRHKRVAAPLCQRACGYDIGVAGKYYGFNSCLRFSIKRYRPFCPQIADTKVRRAAVQALTHKPERSQPRGQQFQAARILRGDGGQGNELFGE